MVNSRYSRMQVQVQVLVISLLVILWVLLELFSNFADGGQGSKVMMGCIISFFFLFQVACLLVLFAELHACMEWHLLSTALWHWHMTRQTAVLLYLHLLFFVFRQPLL